MKTPSIEDLADNSRFELLAAVEHDKIKDFVLQEVINDRKLLPPYMVYQTLLFLGAIFFFTRALVLAFRGDMTYLTVVAASMVFCFTLLVVIHELLHGVALKLAGAPKISFGAQFKRFLFFAEADRFVIGHRRFMFVAFTPLVAIQIATAVGVYWWFSHPLVYFFLMVMCIHSFFCAGDVALATLFYRFPGRKVFTYDNKAERKSYYFVSKTE